MENNIAKEEKKEKIPLLKYFSIFGTPAGIVVLVAILIFYLVDPVSTAAALRFIIGKLLNYEKAAA